jgi:hypothetical protein
MTLLRPMVDPERIASQRIGSILLLLELACSSSRQPSPSEATDCTQLESQYREWIVENYDTWRSSGVPNWYQYGDMTPGSALTGQDGGALWAPGDAGYRWTSPIEDGGPCGTSTALLLESHGFQDYGSGFGTYNFGNLQQGTCDAGALNCTIDAGEYTGVRFWARSLDPRPQAATPYDTTPTVTLTINDKSSYGGAYGSACTIYNPPDGGLGGTGNLPVTNPGQSTLPTGSGAGTLVLPANACGNGFAYPLVTISRWQFFTIPFAAFKQAARPNRAPTGFDPYSFLQLLVIVPKEARLELWFANVGFYGAKPDSGPRGAGP